MEFPLERTIFAVLETNPNGSATDAIPPALVNKNVRLFIRMIGSCNMKTVK